LNWAGEWERASVCWMVSCNIVSRTRLIAVALFSSRVPLCFYLLLSPNGSWATSSHLLYRRHLPLKILILGVQWLFSGWVSEFYSFPLLESSNRTLQLAITILKDWWVRDSTVLWESISSAGDLQSLSSSFAAWRQTSLSSSSSLFWMRLSSSSLPLTSKSPLTQLSQQLYKRYICCQIQC